MYYLQSRYYDPQIGRFINADSYASTGQGFVGCNMFAYCGNNPVNYSDPYGHRFEHHYVRELEPGYDYITDQSEGPWSDMSLGSSTVGKMGCGQVATYNALLTLGDPTNFMDIYNYYEHYPSGLTDHGKNGLMFLYVAGYFHHKGYNVVLSWSGNPTQFEQYSQAADACIMLYQYGSLLNSGGHYVEYAKYGDSYIGRNTSDRNGITYFSSPVEYGLKGSRYMVIGIFIFKPQ